MTVKESTKYESLIGEKIELERPTNLAEFLGEDPNEIYTEEWKEHWQGMPEFVQEDNKPFKTVIVHFRTNEDYLEFQKLIDQKLTDKTKSIWHPGLDKDANSLLRWIEE
jgi:hypothetical protein